MPLSKEKQTKLPKKFKQGDLPQNNKEWIRYINSLHDAGLKKRHKYEFQWVLNMAYFLGYQHLIWNTRTGNIQIPQSMSSPLTINRIGSFTEARHAKLTKQRPVPRVIPNTPDLDDQNAAKFGGRVLDHLWRKIDMDEEYDATIMQMLIFGTSFMENLWDPFSGDPFTRNRGEGENILQFKQDGSADDEQVFPGEVSSKCVNPFQLIPASDQKKDIKDQDWIIKRDYLSLSEILKRYPHLKGKVEAKDGEDIRTEQEKTLERLASPISSSVGIGLSHTADSINSELLCKTFYMKPNEQHPDGFIMVIIQNEVAWTGPFPNDYGKNVYPIVKFTEKNDGIHFWQQSTIEKLMSIQRAYNRLRQKKLNNIYLMANGKWLLPKGSQVSEDSITDEEAEIIEYNSAVPAPQQAQLTSLPNYAREMANELLTDFRDVGGQRESTLSPPPNVTAGVAMQIAAELGDEIIGPILRRLGRSMSRVANQQLLILDQEYIEDRIIQIIGPANEFGVTWFKQGDLRNQTDVHIEIESLFPDFRGSKRQTLLDLWDRRVIQDPAQLLKAYRFGNFDMIVEEQEKKDEMVWLEIESIKKGKEPEITPFQDHANHVRILNQWVASPEFLRLIPERKQLAIIVVQAHLQFLIQSLPQQGAPVQGQNQNAVGTPFGAQVPVGAGGNQGPQG